MPYYDIDEEQFDDFDDPYRDDYDFDQAWPSDEINEDDDYEDDGGDIDIDEELSRIW